MGSVQRWSRPHCHAAIKRGLSCACLGPHSRSVPRRRPRRAITPPVWCPRPGPTGRLSHLSHRHDHLLRHGNLSRWRTGRLPSMAHRGPLLRRMTGRDPTPTTWLPRAGTATFKFHEGWNNLSPTSRTLEVSRPQARRSYVDSLHEETGPAHETR